MSEKIPKEWKVRPFTPMEIRQYLEQSLDREALVYHLAEHLVQRLWVEIPPWATNIADPRQLIFNRTVTQAPLIGGLVKRLLIKNPVIPGSPPPGVDVEQVLVHLGSTGYTYGQCLVHGHQITWRAFTGPVNGVHLGQDGSVRMRPELLMPAYAHGQIVVCASHQHIGCASCGDVFNLAVAPTKYWKNAGLDCYTCMDNKLSYATQRVRATDMVASFDKETKRKRLYSIPINAATLTGPFPGITAAGENVQVSSATAPLPQYISWTEPAFDSPYEPSSNEPDFLEMEEDNQ